jgi:hypothetical protein
MISYDKAQFILQLEFYTIWHVIIPLTEPSAKHLKYFVPIRNLKSKLLSGYVKDIVKLIAVDKKIF